MFGVQRNGFLPDAEIRVFLLIAAFSGTRTKPGSMGGVDKLAKLDFLLRYPRYLAGALRHRGAEEPAVVFDADPLLDRVVRRRYRTWSPSHNAILGNLLGRGLIEAVPTGAGIGYRTTNLGRDLADSISKDETWEAVNQNAELVKRHLDMNGAALKTLLCDATSEIANPH